MADICRIRFGKKSAECRSTACPAQQLSTSSRWHCGFQKLAAHGRHVHNPFRPLRSESGFQLPPQPCSKSWAGTTRGYCDLKWTAVHHCRIDEVAMVEIIHCIAQHTSSGTSPKHGSVRTSRISCCDCKKRIINVRGQELAVYPLDLAIPFEPLDRGHTLRADDRHLGTIQQQACDLTRRNHASADDHTLPSPQIDEERKECTQLTSVEFDRRTPTARSRRIVLPRRTRCLLGRSVFHSSSSSFFKSTHHVDEHLQRMHLGSVTVITEAKEGRAYSSAAFETPHSQTT